MFGVEFLCVCDVNEAFPFCLPYVVLFSGAQNRTVLCVTDETNWGNEMTFGSIIRVALAFAFCAACLVGHMACLPSQAPPPDGNGKDAPAKQATLEELLADWHERAKDADANFNTQACIYFGQQLSLYGPDAFDSLFDVLADPQATPKAKVMVTNTVQYANLDTTMLSRLIPLVSDEHDGTTRACAAKLLTGFPGDYVLELLKTLRDDKEERVRFVATLGLAVRNDAAARDALLERSTNPTTTADERYDIIKALSRGLREQDMVVFEHALKADDMGPRIWNDSIIQLGREGSPSAITVLEECVARDDRGEELQTLAKEALAALRSRHGTLP